MARLKVTWTIDVDVPDFSLTAAQIDDLAEAKAKEFAPKSHLELDYAWISEPKAKGSQKEPPDDFWFDSVIGPVASNGCLLIVKGFPLPPEFEIGDWHWRPEPDDCIPRINTMIDKDIAKMRPHAGWFNQIFRPFLEVAGLEVLGESPAEVGYLVLDGKLSGILMPLQSQKEGSFRFCREK